MRKRESCRLRIRSTLPQNHDGAVGPIGIAGPGSAPWPCRSGRKETMLRMVKGRRPLMMSPVRAMALVAGVMLAAPVFVAAQTPAEGQEAPPPYRPGLGDLMTATVQPRHIKLALAGREKNWVYAAYELHQLDEAFERLSIMWPQWRQVRIVEMI